MNCPKCDAEMNERDVPRYHMTDAQDHGGQIDALGVELQLWRLRLDADEQRLRSSPFIDVSRKAVQ